MAKRLNISIPDSIHERLKEFKDSINVSKVCQEALLKEIREKKFLLKNPDTDAIIRRLKEERNDIESIVQQKAKEDAFEWVKTASYQNIVFVVTSDTEKAPYDDIFDYPYFLKKLGVNSHRDADSDEEGSLYGDGEISGYLEKMIPGTFSLDYDTHEREKIDKIYLKEWEKTVKDFWKEIENKL